MATFFVFLANGTQVEYEADSVDFAGDGRLYVRCVPRGVDPNDHTQSWRFDTIACFEAKAVNGWERKVPGVSA